MSSNTCIDCYDYQCESDSSDELFLDISESFEGQDPLHKSHSARQANDHKIVQPKLLEDELTNIQP